MNKDLLVGIGAIIAPVILVFAALTYVSKPAILSNAPEGAATELASSSKLPPLAPKAAPESTQPKAAK